MQAYALLATGMGGLDWSGLPIVHAALELQPSDLPWLIESIIDIRMYRKPEGV